MPVRTSLCNADFMSKSEYSTEDFVLDPEFRKWVLTNDLGAKLYWEEFLGTNKGKLEEIEKARQIVVNFSKIDYSLNEAEENFLWNEIDAKLDNIDSQRKITKVVSLDSWSAIQQNKERLEKRRKKVFRNSVLITSIFLAGLTLLAWFQFPTSENDELPQEPMFETMEAPSGVKSHFNLPDGTEVTLNSESKVVFEKFFDKETREIALEGEAYFEVAKDSLRPFIVTTGRIHTKALGTEFNVKAYPDHLIQISLVEGSVLVSSDSQDSLNEQLNPGEEILANSESSLWEKSNFDLEEITAWMNKTLILKKTPFKETIQSLERWYGVKFIISGKMPEDVFITGKFKDESLKNVLDGISYSTKYNYTIEGKIVKLNLTPK